MNNDHEQAIRRSWQRNARAWGEAIRGGMIESRTRVTNAAVLDAVTALAPASVLDAGCGEGWLCRALRAPGRVIVGTDTTADLIAQARDHDPDGDYHRMDYRALAADALGRRFDLVVCNFSLLDRDHSAALVAGASRLLHPGGHLLIQTPHPLEATVPAYRDGWLPGSWQGFPNTFSDPAPWYFRTLGGWLTLFADAGLAPVTLREPLHPDSGRPASALFIARHAGNAKM